MSPRGPASSNDASSSREAASTLASVQFFNPIAEDAATPSSLASPASLRAPDRSHWSTTNPSTRDPARSPADRKPALPGSAPSPSSTAASSSTPSKVQPPGRTWTSLWRPLSVLIDYAAQQPSFTTYLLCRIDRSLTNIDILDLIPRHTLAHLKPFLKPYILWHPHLPGLDHMYNEHCKRPTVSSALLLSSMCLVACRHAMPLTDPLPVKLSTLIDQLGTQILLSTPRDMYTVQALELLLAHEPSLVGTSVAGSAQAERGNGLLGESLLAAALTIARGLDLDKAIDNLVDLCDRPAPPDDRHGKQRRDLLAKHAAGASIWLSLRIWEGHFSFVNSTVRPIELGDIVDKSDVMVAIDNDGRKIERRERDPFLTTEKRFPGLDEDSILRSAGRTGLVYRLKAMARFQNTIAGMYSILAKGAKQPTPPALIPTTQQTRQELLELLTDSSTQQLIWQSAKHQAFSPFASVRPALLLEDWATMESYSLQELLPCLAICAFMTGELNRGFSANEMIEGLRVDQSFRDQSTCISEKRDVETHLMLSTFHLFDRGLGYSQPDILTHDRARSKMQRGGGLWIEATGAPLLLTTAFATDGCKTFLEKTACSLYGFDHLPVTADMHLVMMVNTRSRLEECDRNEYLPPLRKRSSMPPPSRRLSSLTPDLNDKEEVVQGRSISQIGVIFIDEMAQGMQKWKLGASLHRTVPLHFRHIFGKQRAEAAAQTKDLTSGRPSMDASRRDEASVPRKPDSNMAEGSLSQAQSFSHNFQSSFGAAPQPIATTASSSNGGMFDIPTFDLFGPASTTDWTNHVPWFDPIDTSAPMPGLAPQPAPQWDGVGMGPMQNTWPAPQRQRVDTLPPLQYAGMPPPPPMQPQPSIHAHGYPAHAPNHPAANAAWKDAGQTHTNGHQQHHYNHHRPYYNQTHQAHQAHQPHQPHHGGR